MTAVGRRAVDVDELAHLEEQRDFLLRSLRDLEREREAGDIDDVDYRTLHEDYTARAAAVLRAIEEGRARYDAAVASPERRRRRVRATAATVVAALAVAAIAGALVARSSGERVKGQEVSGGGPSNAVAKQLARAHQLDGQAKVLDAIKAYDAVLKLDPQNLEALTYRGWLVGRFALDANQPAIVDRAFSSLDQAEAIDVTYGPAHCFRGILLFRLRQDAKAAVPELQSCMAANPGPEVRPLVESELQGAMAAAAKP